MVVGNGVLDALAFGDHAPHPVDKEFDLVQIIERVDACFLTDAVESLEAVASCEAHLFGLHEVVQFSGIFGQVVVAGATTVAAHFCCWLIVP